MPIADDYLDALDAFNATSAPGLVACYVCASALGATDDGVPLVLDERDCLTSDPEIAIGGFRAHRVCLPGDLAVHAERFQREWRERVVARDSLRSKEHAAAADLRVGMFDHPGTQP